MNEVPVTVADALSASVTAFALTNAEIVVVKSVFVPPASFIVITFPTSDEVNVALALVKFGVPVEIAPSIQRIPSPLAPYCLTLKT